MQHGPMSLTCSPPQTERGLGVGGLGGVLSLFSIILRETQIQMSTDFKKKKNGTKLDAAGLASCLTFSS